jgi:glutathione S-transferase
MYTLYVIPGSHACRAGMLMLDHKRVPYRRVEFITLTHATMVRLHGFDAGGQTRVAGGKRTLGIRMGDFLGTVPGLADGKRRISTNHRIARYLDEQHPEPPLFPSDPEQRARVEEAEDWANTSLQMDARRIVFSSVLRDPASFSQAAGDGRMGCLLYRNAHARRYIGPWIGRSVFATKPADDAELLNTLSSSLDRVDAWIAEGVLNGPQLNVADFMVAPSLALILYRRDVQPMFEGRPALELVDRLLPEPEPESDPSRAGASVTG